MNGRYCSTCGTPNVPVARFCDACGLRLVNAAGVTCPHCGAAALPGDRFCDECGTALLATAILILEGSGRRLAISERAEIIIGREDLLSGARPDVDLAPHGAESYGVSRRHLRLIRSEAGYRAEDLGSVNLTHVNDQHLEPGRSVELQNGDRIVMGNLRTIFRTE